MMISHAKLREDLLAQPDAALILEELTQVLEAEKAKRKEYYALVHEDTKAEFINGEIIYQSPVKRKHWLVSAKLSARLITFVEQRQLGEVGVEKVLISLTRNDYEPDICFFRKEKASTFKKDQMHFPAPDFVVKILSDSTEKNDQEIKFQDYAAHGVQEDWMIDPDKQTVEQYLNENQTFELRQKFVRSGILQSVVIEGFEVEISDLFA
ncbi:MAG: Uma2 family endonuclease [Saprospiraceae bacterium]|nr:Uma2 family endonuclease [Saprospiraceae bacterium]